MIAQLAARGIDKSRILHVAESLFHDHVPAKRHGLATCWIYRRHDQEGFGAAMDPGERPDVDFQFNSMAAFAAAVAQAHTT
jgi:2-haloacid dehalogenase